MSVTISVSLDTLTQGTFDIMRDGRLLPPAECACCGIVAPVDEEWPYKTCWPPGWKHMDEFSVCPDPACVLAMQEQKQAVYEWDARCIGARPRHHEYQNSHPRPTIQTRVRA